jgi:hypothetical protein
MWIMLYDCFFSIVSKDCAPDELMVRARRPGDIEKVFKGYKATEYTQSDYHYRCAIPKKVIIAALTTEIEDIDYSNFKNAIKDDKFHRAASDMWFTLSRLQPLPPYHGLPLKVRHQPKKKGKR